MIDEEFAGEGASDERSQQRQNRVFYYLALYRTGLILLTAMLLALARGADSGFSLDRALPFLDSTLGAWCIFHLVVLCACPFLHRFPSSLKLQVTADLIFSVAFVWWTGGVESFFLPVLYATVLSTSTFYGLRHALFIASILTLVLSVMTIGWIKGWSPAQLTGMSDVVDERIPFLIAWLILEGVALHIIAYLGARLMGRARRAERINHLIVENIHEGIIALDEKGRVILMNHSALSAFGCRRNSEWKERVPAAVFRRDDDGELVALLADPRSGEHRMQWRISRDRAIPLGVRMTRIRGETRSSSVWLAVLRDLTPELEAAETEARMRRLEETEDLALGLVHEIRNPLASVRGCGQELGRGNLDDEQVRHFTGIIMRESDRLDRIVNEFLEYSRTAPTRQENVDVGACIVEVVETLERRDDAQDVTITTEIAEDVPQLLGQREMVYQVLLNLGINALEATRAGGSLGYTLEVEDAGELAITVEDTGVGMDEETRRRIFTPFFTTKPREGGLGLALVERIVHGHDGSIEVTSRENVGTRFKILFPGERCRAPEVRNERATAGVVS